MSQFVYFPSSSENTHRFMQRPRLPAIRIPLNEHGRIRVGEPYILVMPSYGGGTASTVPRQVIRFLSGTYSRALICGVITSGNYNFGDAYGRAGDVISQECGMSQFYRFELMGTQSGINNVRREVSESWQQRSQSV